jgi:hypothetical protein
LPGLPAPWTAYFTLPAIDEIIDMCHRTHLQIEMGGVSQTFCLDWPQTAILLFSTFQVARITGVNHWLMVINGLWLLLFWITCTYLLATQIENGLQGCLSSRLLLTINPRGGITMWS